MKDLQKENKMTNNIKHITLTPEVFSKVEQEGYETIFYSAEYPLLTYEDGTIKKGDPVNGVYYRRVDESEAGQEGVMYINIFDPETFIPEKRYYKEIEVKRPATDIRNFTK